MAAISAVSTTLVISPSLGRSKGVGLLLQLVAGFLDDRPPLLDFGLVERAERLRCQLLARRKFMAMLGQPLAHRCVLHGIDDSGVQLRDDVLRRAARRPE